MGRRAKGRDKQYVPKRKKVVPEENARHVSYRDEYIKWTTEGMDVDCGESGCAWSWALTSNEAKKLLEFLSTLHTKTWAEVESHRTSNSRQQHHSQRIDSLSKDARRRLGNLGSAEEELFRFRLGSKRRLWGYRSGATFRILWWDEHHQVYPTEPKNT